MPISLSQEGKEIKMSGDEWNRAKDEIRQILVQVAKAQETISYSKLVGRVQTLVFEARDQRLNLILDEISNMEDEKGRGLLSVIVIHEGGNKMPGLGFFRLAKSRGRNENDFKCWIDESQKVYSYWSQQASDPGKG